MPRLCPRQRARKSATQGPGMIVAANTAGGATRWRIVRCA